MSKQDFNFIELPKQDNMLSEQEQEQLTGGICIEYGPCGDPGSCGGQMYCFIFA